MTKQYHLPRPAIRARGTRRRALKCIHTAITNIHQQSTGTSVYLDANMDLGANAIAKSEPFLLMSKSAKGAAAAKLIQDATSAPGVFVFAELLDQPNIQEVLNNMDMY